MKASRWKHVWSTRLSFKTKLCKMPSFAESESDEVWRKSWEEWESSLHQQWVLSKVDLTARREGWLGLICGISFEFLDVQSVSYETIFIPSLPSIPHYLILVFNHLSLLILSLCLMKGCFNHHGKGKSDLGGFKVTWTKGSKQVTQAIIKL